MVCLQPIPTTFLSFNFYTEFTTAANGVPALDHLNSQVKGFSKQLGVADIKAKFIAIALLACARQKVIITHRGKLPCQFPIVLTYLRMPFPDTPAQAIQSKPSQAFEYGSSM